MILQPKQIEGANYWLDKETEEFVYGGGKMGGKSYLGCSLIFGDALTYPGTLYFIARHDLIDLKRFTTPSIHEVFEHWGIEPGDYMKYNGQDSLFDLKNGSKVFFFDCKQKPSDPDFHGFGSMQFTRGWIEETGQIKDKAIVNLMASVGRWKNDEYNLKRKVLLTCNPNKGYAYKNFYLPWEKGELPKFRKYVQALPKHNKKAPRDYIQMLYRLPKDEYERLVLGNWHYDDDPTKLIQFDKILDLWSNDHVEGGKKYITADIARFGKGKTDIWVWNALRVIEIKAIKRTKVPESVEAIRILKKKHSVPMSNIIVDEGNVGGGVVDLLPGCKGFIANKKPIAVGVRSNYANLKAQCTFMLSEYVNNGKIWIVTEDYKDEIIEELEQVKKTKELTDKKPDVISKEEVKEFIRRSPDHMDNMLMRMWFEIAVKDYFA